MKRHIPRLALYVLLVAAFPAARVLGLSNANAVVQDSKQSQAFDDAVRIIQRATIPRHDGEHLRLLRSLRQLHDPSLEPIFSALGQVDDPIIRIHAILACGELSESGQVDPWKLHQLPSTRYRLTAIGEALRIHLIEKDGLQQILQWEDLSQPVEISTLLALGSLGEALDTNRILNLVENGKEEAVRLRAALLLKEIDPTQDIRAILEEIQAIPRSIREQQLIIPILRDLQEHPLPSTAGWIANLLDAPDVGSMCRVEAILTLFGVDVERGSKAWLREYTAAQSLAHRIRLALMAAEMSPRLQPGLFDVLLADEEPIIVGIGQTAQAIASGSSPVEPGRALVARHHAPSTGWLLQLALDEKTAPDTAVGLLALIIDDTLVDGPALDERLQLARGAAARLVELDVPTLRDRLLRAQTRQRRLTEEAIMYGIAESDSTNTLTLTQGVDHWVSTRSGSIAIVLKARHTETLDPADLERLTIVFGARGGVSSTIAVQAAWLYLNQTKQQGAALALILGQISP